MTDILRKTTTTILQFSAISLLAVASAQAGPSKDAAYDERGGFVSDSWGKCVRTKWVENDDPCNPTPPPPPPAPVAAPPPPPPVVSLEQRTVYFAFDSAELDEEAMNKLNILSQIINQSARIGDVQIIGYTDQIGSSDYNQKLSEHRVKSVEDYLDKRSRLDTQAADIRGLGEAPPEEQCENLKKRQEKIDCMRTERRVEIEFKYVK